MMCGIIQFTNVNSIDINYNRIKCIGGPYDTL